MEILLFWLALSIVAAIIAGSKNRNWFGYLVLSLLLSPLIGIILVACLPAIPEKVIETVPAKQVWNDEKGRVEDVPVVTTHKPCPYCAEEVLIAAIRCKHCQSDIET